MSPASRICRFRALQDVLDDLEPLRESGEPSARAAASREAALVALGALVPNVTVQQALHLVDAGDSITCVRSQRGRQVYEVRGGRESHLVVSSGLYCSCPYFGRQVLEAGELCCKHWLAVQLARRCRVGLAASSTLGEVQSSVPFDTSPTPMKFLRGPRVSVDALPLPQAGVLAPARAASIHQRLEVASS